jgi:hypothetical protein
MNAYPAAHAKLFGNYRPTALAYYSGFITGPHTRAIFDTFFRAFLGLATVLDQYCDSHFLFSWFWIKTTTCDLWLKRSGVFQ